MIENKEKVIIPKTEIQKLEKVRAELWDFADRHNFNALQMAELESITSVMYRIANKKWAKKQ